MSGSPETLGDLSLARGTLDRAGLRRRDPDLLPLLLKDPLARIVELAGGRARVVDSDGGCALFLRPPVEEDARRLAVFLGQDSDGTPYVGVVGDGPADGQDDGPVDGATDGAKGGGARDDPTNPQNRSGIGHWGTLREVGVQLSDRDAGIFATLLGLVNWHAAHLRCPLCGAASEPDQAGWIRRCTRDGSEHHPRTDPAVIMAVTDAADRLLLARSPSWPPGRLSVLAGFVEPGESLEAAVAREVLEEVGVVVEEVRYLGNQPWPFPSSLMVGFTARAVDPALHLDPQEIAEAVWVSRGELHEMVREGRFGVAPNVSIARRMIEHWFGAPIDQRLP